MPTYQVTHAGFIREAVDALKRTLAQSYRVQQWLGLQLDVDPVGSTTAEIVAFSDEPPEDGEQYAQAERLGRLPRVFVQLPQQTVLSVARRGVDGYDSAGALAVVMERQLTGQELASDNVLTSNLTACIGDLVEELRESSTSGATLDWTAIGEIEFGRLEQTEDVGAGPELAVISFVVSWGRSRT